MPASSTALANEFIRLAKADGKFFTQMQLQKLVYIAHGWNLAINGTPLTADNPEAWQYGPVYKDLRNALKHYGSQEIRDEITKSDIGIFDETPFEPIRVPLKDPEMQVLERVYKKYGKFHAYQLSALTHQDDTPWYKIYQDGHGRFDDIPSNLIRDHFVEIAHRNQYPH